MSASSKIEKTKIVEENRALKQILGEMVYLLGGYKYEIKELAPEASENVDILNKATEAMFKDLGIAAVDKKKD